MLHIEHLHFKYSRRGKTIFSDFNLQFESGKIYGLLGKNGTGKSTLLYLLTGLLRPQQGTVTYNGQSVTDRSPKLLQDLFLVPEEPYLPDLTMSAYKRTLAPFYPHFSDEILHDCLSHFGLSDTVRFSKLSMGERKKMYVSFALAAQTRYLLMDEPTNGLDIPSKSIFRKVVSRHMTDERTLIISSHQVNDIDMLLDHVVILNESQLLLSRSIAEICDTLCFTERPVGMPTDDAIFSQPSITGNALITLRQDEDEETPLNLELLFNGALAGSLPQSLLSNR